MSGHIVTDMKLVFLAAEHPSLLLGQGIHRIGSAADADVVLSEMQALPHHAELQVGAQGISLRPMQGAAIKVNESPVSGPIAVRSGDVLTIGDMQMRLEALVATPAANAAQASAEGQAAVTDEDGAGQGEDLAATRVMPALPRYVLRGISSAGFGRTFPLVGPTVVGRSTACDIHLDHPGLSRQQARLTPTVDGLLVEDLGSTNGTLINEQVVTKAVARHGDEIGFDVMRFRLVATTGAAEAEPAAAPPSARSASSGSSSWTPWIAGAVAIGVLIVVLILVAGRLL